MAPPAGSQLQLKQRKSNHKLRRVVQPLAAFSAHEHDAVGRALLSVTSTLDSPDCPLGMPAMSTEEALERVAVWKLRLSRLPHAVESTAALAQVLLRTNNPSPHAMSSTMLSSGSSSATASSVSSLLELQHALACAVLRTVNGLADALQQQRAYAASVAVLCRELGIPSWLVDLRHAATHNQLPTLPVLQLAATSLLRYLQTVYWEPLAERRQEQYRHAGDLLRAYNEDDGEQVGRIKTLAALKTSSSVSISNTTNNSNGKQALADKVMESSESEDDDDDDDDSEDLDALVRSMLPIPGTNANRFAPLLDDGKKNKAKKRAAALDPSVTSMKDESVAGTPASAPKKKRVRTNGSHQRQVDVTRSMCAKLFIRSKLPLDIKYEAALDFLLGDNGVLLQPKNPQDGDTNSFSLADLQLHYETLLVALCRAWPGFLAALLIRSVNLVLALTNGPALSERAAEYIVQWMHYWLSSSFVHSLVVDHHPATLTIRLTKAKVRGTGKNGKNSTSLAETVLAPWSMLQAAPLRLPLNSLCDRCVAFAPAAAAAADGSHYPSVAALKQLFEDILGDERCVNFGVADDTLIQSDMASHEHYGHSIRLSESVVNFSVAIASPNPSMSLEAMEAFLAEDGRDHDKDDAHGNDFVVNSEMHERVPRTTTKTTTWVRCASWEPCSIGTLPGCGGGL